MHGSLTEFALNMPSKHVMAAAWLKAFGINRNKPIFTSHSAYDATSTKSNEVNMDS